MHVAQSGIFALGTGSHSYLEFDFHAQGDPLTLVQLMASLGEPRMTTGGVNLVVGFRPSLWKRVAPEEAPIGVTDFEKDLRGVDGYTMPATQHDLWVWVAGHAYHTVFDITREAIVTLAPVAQLATEVAGWTYKESRDLTGFIDGTEKPEPDRGTRLRAYPRGRSGRRRHHPPAPEPGARRGAVGISLDRGSGTHHRPLEVGQHRTGGQA